MWTKCLCAIFLINYSIVVSANVSPVDETNAATRTSGSYHQGGAAEEEPVVISERAICLGCMTDANENDPKIQEIASFAIDSYVGTSDGQPDQGQTLIRVINAKTQIVAGFKYVLDLEVGWNTCNRLEYKKNPDICYLDPTKDSFVCRFEVVEQSWLKKKTLTFSKCDQETGVSDELGIVDENDVSYDSDNDKATRKRRDINSVGPHTSQLNYTNDNETFKSLANFAVQQLDRIDEDTKARFAVAVLSGIKRTISVPGWLYQLKIRVAYTECEEESQKTYEECKKSVVLPNHICHVKILFQPWQTVQSKMTESQCYPESKKYRNQKSYLTTNEIRKSKHSNKILIGGYTIVDPNSEEISRLAEFTVSFLDGMQNSLHAQKLVRVVEAYKQVVNGVKTKLSIELGYTGCRNTAHVERSKCDIDANRDHQVCNVTVWEQPWRNSTKVTSSKCGNVNEVAPDQDHAVHDHRNRRSPILFSFSENTDPDRIAFGEFMRTHKKSYERAGDLEYRFQIFKDNMKKVKLLQENEQGTATYGATVFADLTEEEFSKHHLGLRPDLRQHRHKKQAKIPYLVRIPEEFDWRHYNVVTPVKNQGFCGSCWAFSVTGNIEGAYALKHQSLISFSEQELVDCDTLDQGCNGGLPENAYKSLEKLGGLESETVYPYDGRDEKCHFNSSDKLKAKVSGFVEVSKNETEMAMWLVKRGPMSIGINANAMQFYFGGVSHPWKFLCSTKSLDHGVLIVGYGVHTTTYTHKKIPYWIVKNSWGPHWGEQGYYRVYRGQNTCGLAEMVTSATVA